MTSNRRVGEIANARLRGVVQRLVRVCEQRGIYLSRPVARRGMNADIDYDVMVAVADFASREPRPGVLPTRHCAVRKRRPTSSHISSMPRAPVRAQEVQAWLVRARANLRAAEVDLAAEPSLPKEAQGELAARAVYDAVLALLPDGPEARPS